MQTIDIHTHLLSSEVKFDRFYDKLAIRFFAKKFGMEPKALMENPYDRYAKIILEYFDESNPIYTNYQKILDKI